MRQSGQQRRPVNGDHEPRPRAGEGPNALASDRLPSGAVTGVTHFTLTSGRTGFSFGGWVGAFSYRVNSPVTSGAGRAAPTGSTDRLKVRSRP